MAIFNGCWANDLSLGCLPAASQLASARHLPKPLKITFALSSINCYEVKTPKIVNGRTAKVFICNERLNWHRDGEMLKYMHTYKETYMQKQNSIRDQYIEHSIWIHNLIQCAHASHDVCIQSIRARRPLRNVIGTNHDEIGTCCAN